MQEIPHILGFTAGELTPWLATRYDLQAYQRGAALIRNFIVQPYGGVKRRNGTAFVAECGAGTQDAVKLFPFSYSESDALMLEFFCGGMRVYREGRMLTGSDGAPYVCTVPWRAAEQILSLRFTQVNDAVYVTCPTHRPVVLYRHGDTDWRCEEPEFEPFPRATYERQDGWLSVRMSSSGDTAELTLPENAEQFFTPDMPGGEYVLAEAEVSEKTLFRNEALVTNYSYLPDLQTSVCEQGTVYCVLNRQVGMNRFWYCTHSYGPADYNGSTDPDDYPAFFMAGFPCPNKQGRPYEVCGDWELRTQGAWNAQWELWRSYDTYETDPDYLRWSWTCIKSFGQSPYAERQNWALSGSESRPCRMLIVCRETSDNGVGAVLFFRTFRGSREYKFLITEVKDERRAVARVCTRYTDGMLNFDTQHWSFGAFGAGKGYPAFSSYSAGRLWFGGMRHAPTTLIGSVTDDFHNFRVSSEDDSALHLTIASDNQSRICWIAPTRQLLVGASDGVWMLGGGDGSGVLTPTNAAFRRQTSVGCENQPALAVENCILFPQRGGKRLREISYKLESDGFAASDLSLLAEHLLGSGVREYAVQESSGSYVWVVLNDGTAAVLTLHPEQQVTAWQRVEIPGCRILHVAALPRADEGTDEVWLVLQRGEGAPLTMQRICAENSYLDDALSGMTDAEGAWQLPLRYAGETVQVLCAGRALPELTVPPDALLTGLPADTRCTVGYAFASELRTMPTESLNSFNSVREMSRLRLRLLESSLNFEYKADHAERWEKMDAERYHLRAPYTGSVRLSQMPEAAVGQGLCLRCSGTEDFRLLGLTVEVDHHGK